MQPVFMGSFENTDKGEQVIYEKYPYKQGGILTQFAQSKTLEGANKTAKKCKIKGSAFIIHDTTRRKYFIYL